MSCFAAVVFADGFEEIEGVAVVDTLRRAGVETMMIGLTDTTVTGAHDITLTMNTRLAAANLASVDALVLPGGMPGAALLADSQAVLAALNAVAKAGGLVAAVCAAPMALGAAGLLADKKYTCYPGFEEKIEDGTYTGARVEVDGRVVTGLGPGAAIEFALEIARQLGLPEKADELQQGMMVQA